MTSPGAFDNSPIEYECEDFRLVDVSAALPQRPGKVYGTRPAAAIREVVIHQTQGQTIAGRDGLLRTNEFFIGDDNPATPELEGRGWPGIGYHFYVPFKPEFTNVGRPILYRCHADDVLSWHTHSPPFPSRNHVGVGVAFQGCFKSKSNRTGGRPSDWQRTMFRPLLRYLLERYRIEEIDVFGHSDWGKPDCPGDELDEQITGFRCDAAGRVAGIVTAAHTLGWRKRQELLCTVGALRAVDVDGAYGPVTRHAIERIEKQNEFPLTGLWSRPVETFLYRQLKAQEGT